MGSPTKSNNENNNNNNLSDDDISLEELIGVYIKAFCSGINDILTIYKEHLLAIEHEYLKDRSLTVSSL